MIDIMTLYWHYWHWHY